MWIQTSTYADFQLIVAALGLGAIFYHDGGGSNFQVTVVTLANVGVRLTSAGAKPGSFLSDYPTAISISVDPAFG